jgi:CheY-like chemotaxis protein
LADTQHKRPRLLRVLVVDDDRDTALSLIMLLSEEGYEVQSVYSGGASWSR